MTERLALGLIPGTGWRAAEIKDVARAAEDAGFEAVFCAEVNNNALATAQSMGEATHRITGRITFHRLQGAVVLYLSLATIFASAFGLNWQLSPGAFVNVVAPAGARRKSGPCCISPR
jgi:alkanesulfonate monooxygenase SsuD/methylene tetrahydromethanopterin reductase-like flavin-dependent oxidoreductase (luciferase family)